MLRDDVEDAARVLLARHLDVDVADVELEQVRQQLGVVDVGAVRRVHVPARARVHADPGTLVVGEALEDAVVERHEVPEKPARRIELAREPALGEVDLDLVGAGVERRADVLLTLADEVVQERVPGVALDPVLRVQEAEGRRGDDGLLDRHVRALLRLLQVARRVGPEPERSRREGRQLPRVAVRERDHDAVGREVRHAVERIGHEARLGLLAVRDHGRARLLEALDRIRERLVLKRAELLGRDRSLRERRLSVDQGLRSRDAADGLGRDHLRSLLVVGRMRASAYDTPSCRTRAGGRPERAASTDHADVCTVGDGRPGDAGGGAGTRGARAARGAGRPHGADASGAPTRSSRRTSATRGSTSRR